MEAIIIVVLGIFLMGVIGFFLAISHSGRITTLTKRLTQLETELAHMRNYLNMPPPHMGSGTPHAAPQPGRARSVPPSPAPDPGMPAMPAAPKPSPVPAQPPLPLVQPAFASENASPNAMPALRAEKAAEPAAPAAPAPLPVEAAQPAALSRPLVTEAASVKQETVAPTPSPSKSAAEEKKINTSKPETTETGKTDWEARIGKRWLTWGGVMLLVAATGFLIKYAYDQGWIGPWTQIAIGIAVGCGLCVLGDWQVRVRNMRPLGQGVMGLGLTLVYLTCFGAYAYFKLAVASQLTTLALLAATSGAGILLSNRHRSMPICILAAIGGYLAPILVSTGAPPPVNGLFTYTVLVNLGVIVVSMIRIWPALPLLAFAGTIVHFWGWHVKFYQPGLSATVGMWAAIFHFIFLILPALPLLRGRRQTPWQWLLPVANAVLGVYVTWTHLRTEHPLALMLTLAVMAAVHIALGLKTRKLDESAIVRELYSILGLSILTLAPLAWLGMQANLVCWLALGLLLVELGCRLGFRPYLGFGYLNLIISVGWCVIKLWTAFNGRSSVEQFATFGLGHIGADFVARSVERSGDAAAFLASLFSLQFFWTRLLVPIAWGGCALILHRWREKNAQRFLAPKIIAGVGAALLALIFISNDVNPWICLTTQASDPRFALGYGLGPLWCLGMAGVALAGWRWKIPTVSWLAIIFLVPSTILIARLYFHASLPDGRYFLNAAYFAKLFFSLCCMAVAWTIGGTRKSLCAGIAGYLIILTQHSELYSWAGDGEYWLWSLTWNIGSVAYLVLGWQRKNRDLAACFWPPLATAAVFAAIAMQGNIETTLPVASFANTHYLAAMLIAAALFIQALAADKGRLWIAIVAGWVLLAVNHAELYGWFRQQADFGKTANTYALESGIALLYNAGALLYAALHWRFKLKELRIGALPAALMVVAYEIGAFYLRRRLDVLPAPFLNLFFMNALLLALAVFFAALGSQGLRVWLGILGGYILLLATHLEIGYWQGPWIYYTDALSRTAWYTALWSAGALAYLGAAIRYRRKMVYFAALRVLSVALFCAGWQYAQTHRGDYMLFLNARFLTSFLALATLFVLCRISKHYERDTRKNGFVNISGAYRRYMYVLAAVAGFLLLSFECYQWCFMEWDGGQAGRRVANMSLSIAWGFYSIFLLITGFATRIRGWRLSGLILFGVTCLKLVIVDLARLEQLHRILSFMAVGLLLMAASYLYHKLEKRLKEKEPEQEKGKAESVEEV